MPKNKKKPGRVEGDVQASIVPVGAVTYNIKSPKKTAKRSGESTRRRVQGHDFDVKHDVSEDTTTTNTVETYEELDNNNISVNTVSSTTEHTANNSNESSVSDYKNITDVSGNEMRGKIANVCEESYHIDDTNDYNLERQHDNDKQPNKVDSDQKEWHSRSYINLNPKFSDTKSNQYNKNRNDNVDSEPYCGRRKENYEHQRGNSYSQSRSNYEDKENTAQKYKHNSNSRNYNSQQSEFKGGRSNYSSQNRSYGYQRRGDGAWSKTNQRETKREHDEKQDYRNNRSNFKPARDESKAPDKTQSGRSGAEKGEMVYGVKQLEESVSASNVLNPNANEFQPSGHSSYVHISEINSCDEFPSQIKNLRLEKSNETVVNINEEDEENWDNDLDSPSRNSEEDWNKYSADDNQYSTYNLASNNVPNDKLHVENLGAENWDDKAASTSSDWPNSEYDIRADSEISATAHLDNTSKFEKVNKPSENDDNDEHFLNTYDVQKRYNRNDFDKNKNRRVPSNDKGHSKRYSAGNTDRDEGDWRNKAPLDDDYKKFWESYKENKKNNFEKIIEKEQDLLGMSKDYSLAHCVAEDMSMGSGIAVQFRRDFKRVDELLNQRQKQGGLAILEDKNRFIYYLVTKRESTGKPTYEKFWCSLKKMRDHIRENNVKKLAIPRLGCGLDRLEWSKVKDMLAYLFADLDTEIIVCNFQQDDAPPQKIRNSRVVHAVKSVVAIEEYTIIIYLSSEDGYVSEIMEALDKKFGFMLKFRTSPKSVGEVIRFEKGNYILYGCITNKKHTDKFDFVHFQKCVSKINKANYKDEYEYIAFEAIVDKEDDDLFNTKLLNILKNTMRNVDVYICGTTDTGTLNATI